MRRIHALLGIQSLVAILVSVNRLGTWTLGYVLPNEFLRWVDFNNMLVLPLISVVASYLLKKTIEYDSPQRESREHIAWNLIFIVGLYLLAASYGNHEVTNYLHQRFCATDTASDLCRIVIFNDDEFSHWVFFTGFVMVNAAILFLQSLFPHREQMTGTDFALLALNALFLGAVCSQISVLRRLGLISTSWRCLPLFRPICCGGAAGSRCLFITRLHTGSVWLAA